MSIDILILGLLWGASFFWGELVSHLFEPLLVVIVTFSGVCYGLARYFKRPQLDQKQGFAEATRRYRISPGLLSTLHALSGYFLPLLLLLVVRSFVVDVSRVVSGSLKPTILIGDSILINKYRYGIRLPLKGNLLVPIGSPKRGDIVAFRLPKDRSKVFIKRVIGVPGEHIQYSQKQLSINGKPATQVALEIVQDQEKDRQWLMIKSEENLPERKHAIYTALDDSPPMLSPFFNTVQNANELSLRVPKGQYFVMGDNRDNSLDSRHWGFVPASCLLGEVHYVVFSWNSMARWGKPLTWIRWERLAMTIV